jgi:hypothetical protein
MSGSLIFTPSRAMLLRDTETFGTMDLYIIAEIDGSQKQKTKTLDNGGTKPDFSKMGIKWSFRLTEGQNLLQVQVWNEYTLKSDK